MRTLTKILKKLNTEEEIDHLLVSLFTKEELTEFETRLKIINYLKQGMSQRVISSKLKVGIATVSRGAKEIKKGHFKNIVSSL